MDKATLQSAIRNSGGSAAVAEQVDGLLSKLECLQGTGRYGRLMANIASANDKSNFLASVLEATFAFQFESVGLPLEYEVKQDEEENSSIDFLRVTDSGISIFFETRLLQQDKATTDSIGSQLEKHGFWKIAMNGDDQHDAIIRLQRIILSKVERQDGSPTKFFKIHPDIVNIVVVDASEIMLGPGDLCDCLLAAHGDPAVSNPVYRLGIFGLFQGSSPRSPQWVQGIAKRYAHIRSILSGILFLFKCNESSAVNYCLEQHLMWNPRRIESERATVISSEIASAIPIRLYNDEASTDV